MLSTEISYWPINDKLRKNMHDKFARHIIIYHITNQLLSINVFDIFFLTNNLYFGMKINLEKVMFEMLLKVRFTCVPVAALVLSSSVLLVLKICSSVELVPVNK